MNICITTDLFPPEGGGSERSTYFLAKGLAKRGHNILVVMPHFGQKTVYEEHKWFKIIRFRYLRAPDVPVFRNIVKNELFCLFMAKKLKKILKDYRIELIHAQNILTIPPSVIAGRNTKIPVIGTIRDYWPICFRRSFTKPNGNECDQCNFKNLVNCVSLEGVLPSFSMPVILPYIYANLALKQLLLNKTDHVIAVSEALRKLLLTRLPLNKLKNCIQLPSQRISVVPNIMPSPSKILTKPELMLMRRNYKFNENTKLILFVGQLTYEKGILVLIRAIKQLSQKNPSVKFAILGKGPLTDYIKKMQASIGDQFRYFGFLPYNEVLKFYQMADIVVSPSIWPEPLSRVIIEAMALGRPVIATNVGGTPEIITHEKNGILIEPGNPIEIENAINRLINDSDLRFHIGLEGKKTIEKHYNEASICDKILSLYHRVLSSY
ncbi:glycosyltransferase family 4 protein [Candidatus Borrarchaeum sp.]|uniref:glycosyltransferase family 4 protein n=1 Tax=Candidatus Borrarchaeum sp. TaxID=2846742 RepID=UPI00257F00A0|nr:glycosyltransferase family 4 protein [Candidatus Borrarchaeum sp.]